MRSGFSYKRLFLYVLLVQLTKDLSITYDATNADIDTKIICPPSPPALVILRLDPILYRGRSSFHASHIAKGQ